MPPPLALRSSRALPPPARSPASAASVRPLLRPERRLLPSGGGGARRTTVVGRAPAGAEGEGGRKEGRCRIRQISRRARRDETKGERERESSWLVTDGRMGWLVGRSVWIDRCLVSVSATMCQDDDAHPASGRCLEGIVFMVDE